MINECIVAFVSFFGIEGLRIASALLFRVMRRDGGEQIGEAECRFGRAPNRESFDSCDTAVSDGKSLSS